MEIVIVLAIVSALLGIVVPVLSNQLDRLAVRSAVAEAAAGVARARDEALAQRTIVATVLVRSRDRTFATLALGHAHDVVLTATRDSIAFDARGVGYGGANFTLIARRGRAADTLVVSRLGRVRF